MKGIITKIRWICLYQAIIYTYYFTYSFIIFFNFILFLNFTNCISFAIHAHMDTLSLTKEARIYNGLKTISLTSGAGKSGQPLVKEWN